MHESEQQMWETKSIIHDSYACPFYGDYDPGINPITGKCSGFIPHSSYDYNVAMKEYCTDCPVRGFDISSCTIYYKLKGSVNLKDIELWHGDCLELMKDIPDKSIDMILCDLPYGTTACEWDSVIPFEPLWEQYNRIIRINGYIVLFSSQPFTTKLINSNINNFSHQWIWDKKMSANPLLCRKMPMKNFEDICVFCFNYDKYDFRRIYFKNVLEFIKKSKSEVIKETNQGLDHCFRYNSLQFNIPTEENYNLLIDKYNLNKMIGFIPYDKLNIYKRVYNPQMIKLKHSKVIGGGKFTKTDFLGQTFTSDKKITNERYPTAIIQFSNRKGETLHPTQKPIELLEYLIKTYTNENETVLDNCMGSGSTGVACKNLNRKFIGIELDDTYFKIAKERIENT